MHTTYMNIMYGNRSSSGVNIPVNAVQVSENSERSREEIRDLMQEYVLKPVPRQVAS